MAAEQVASASESEILVVYPHRWAVPRDTWGLLFDSAEEEIGILVYSGMFLADDPGLLDLFRAKAEQGVRVRILLGDPDSPEVAARGEHEGIGDSSGLQDPQRPRAAATRCAASTGWRSASTRTVLYNSIYRADGELLVNSHIYGKPAVAGAGDAPAPDRGWRRWSAPTWTASSGSGPNPGPSTSDR